MHNFYKTIRLSLFFTLVFAGLISLQAQSNYYVSNSGSDLTGTGTLLAPWKTITYALTRVSNDSKIYIAAGTYEGESPMIISQDNLTLTGVSSTSTIILDTLTSFSSPSYPNDSFITVRGTGVTIQNLTVQGNATDGVVSFTYPQATPNEPYYGIYVAGLSPSSTPANNATLSNVIVDFFGKSGININGGNGVTITNTTSEHNAGAGIYIQDSHNITLTNITTDNNNWGGIGIGTYGHGYNAGTDGILINGTNSFGESMGGGGMYLEEGNYSGGSPVPITFGISSNNSTYDVNFSLQDFKYTLTGPQDDAYNRVAFSDSLIQVVRAAYHSQLGHFLDYNRVTTYLGQATTENVTNSDLLNQVSFPSTDVSMIFTVLPSNSNAQVTVNELPGRSSGIIYPPSLFGDTSAVFLQLSATGLTNYQFSVQVTLDLETLQELGMFDAFTKVVTYDGSTGTWALITGTYSADNPYYHHHPTYTFTTDHFSNFFFVNNVSTQGFYNVKIGNVTSTSGAYVTVPVAINLNNNGGFTNFQSRFTYDATKLEFEFAQYGTGTLVNQDSWAVLFSSTSGQINMAGSGLSPIGTFNKDSLFFQLTFKIIDSSPGSTVVTGDSAYFIADGSTGLFNVDNGTVTYTVPPSPSTMRGDANGDFSVDGNDVVVILNHLNHVITLTGQDSANADANLNGSIDMNDIYYILYYINYGYWPASAPASPSVSVALTNITYDKNGIINIPVGLENSSNLSTIELYLYYDPQKISYQSFKQVLSSSEYFVSANEMSSGVAKFIFAASSLQSGNLTPGKILLRFTSGTPASGTITTKYRINNGSLMDGPVINLGITDVKSGKVNIPTSYEVSQNYPNPFNPSTIINYGIPKSSFVSIKIYNMLGQEVKTLVNGNRQAGTYSVQWDGNNETGQKVSSGAYIYRVIAGENVVVKKMLLLK